MSIVAYSQQDEFDLVNSGQDCMGWTVTDQAGNRLGEVNEMLIETDKMEVDSIMVNGVRVPAENVSLRDGNVVVRGVMDKDKYAETQRTAASAAPVRNYEARTRNTNAKHITGVTREANDNEITIPIIEEQMIVGKQIVKTGGARVRTTMTEKPVEGKVNLREENVTVERHSVDRPVDANTAKTFKEGSFDVTTKAEVPVVSKEARVVEEVVVGKDVSEHVETVRDSVKRTDVKVDEIDENDRLKRKNN